MKKTIYLGADHAGYTLKKQLKTYLIKLKYRVVDVGPKKLDPTDDYPDYAVRVARPVGRKKGVGVLVCGSAEGICIAANKVKGVRAVAVWTLQNAKLSRQHTDANVLCVSGWQLPLDRAKKIVKTWLETSFSGEERYRRRIQKIKRIESK